jgi:pyruvate dehydrogenase E2 component (dihydrolipoamide acetyltransferase)
MSTEILMPALSPTMAEGKLARWLKKEGDAVKSGDVLAEIETDKATMEFEAVDEGVLARILVPEGAEGVKVNAPIAVLAEEGEDVSKAGVSPGARASTPAASPQPAPAAGVAAPSVAGGTPALPAKHDAPGNRVFASPLARRIAKDRGIDLAGVKGSGPHGRIVKADVDGHEAAAPAAIAAERAVAAAPPKPAPAAKPALPELGPPYTEVPNSTMRKTIARRLTEAKATIPHFYLTVDCDIDPLLKLRTDLNSRLDGGKLSVNDLLIRCVALALRKVPAANASWTDSAIRLYSEVDISIAVATPGGLITPIIKSADKKGLGTISAEMKDLATRARDGKLKPEEYQGGGFTISNLGMFGIREFAAIINPPQGCILAVGAGEQRPVVKNGALAVATMMTCTLSVDHRVVDGAVGAEFLAAFKKLVEDPLSLML